jgi:hypothetical protein
MPRRKQVVEPPPIHKPKYEFAGDFRVVVASDIIRTTGECFTVWTEVGIAHVLDSGKGIKLKIRPGISISGTAMLFPPTDRDYQE